LESNEKTNRSEKAGKREQGGRNGSGSSSKHSLGNHLDTSSAIMLDLVRREKMIREGSSRTTIEWLVKLLEDTLMRKCAQYGRRALRRRMGKSSSSF